VEEVEIIQSHLEEAEIEIFSKGRITETKEIGIVLAMILEIKSSLHIINHKETIIKKESFILKSCRIQTIQIIPKKVSLTKIVFMIRKKSRRIDHILENNKKIKIIILKELDHIEEEVALEEEEVVDSKIMMENRKMKRLLDHFQPKIFNLIIRKT
jgi:hypothetical protein